MYGFNYLYSSGNKIIFEFAFSHLKESKKNAKVNSYTVQIVKVFNKEHIHKNALFSVYINLGVSALVSEKHSPGFNFGLGVFYELKHLIPEVFINYGIILDERKKESFYHGVEKYFFIQSQFGIGLGLNGIIKISSQNTLTIKPSLLIINKNEIMNVQMGFTL